MQQRALLLAAFRPRQQRAAAPPPTFFGGGLRFFVLRHRKILLILPLVLFLVAVLRAETNVLDVLPPLEEEERPVAPLRTQGSHYEEDIKHAHDSSTTTTQVKADFNTLLTDISSNEAENALSFFCPTISDAGPGSGSNNENGRDLDENKIRSNAKRCASMFDGKSFVLSTYYAAPKNQSFYHNRAAPSLDWITVFLLSFFDVVGAKPTIHAEQDAQQHPPHYPVSSHPQERVIFFCDENTAFEIVKQIRAQSDKNWLVEEGWLVVVVVPSKEDVRLKRPPSPSSTSSSTMLLHRYLVYMQRYMDILSEPFATEILNAANSFRFAFYRMWLLAWARHHHLHNNDNAGNGAAGAAKFMFADSTDVVFQSNPFSQSHCFPPSAVSYDNQNHNHTDHHQFSPSSSSSLAAITYFTLESSAKSFRNEKYNRNWISCYHKNVLREMHRLRRPISCAGVTFGSALGVLEYATRQLSELQNPDLVQCSRDSIRAALDQATHNYLLYRSVEAANAAASTVPQHPININNDGSGEERDKSQHESPNTWIARQLHHEDQPCTFHGNFGKLNVEKTPNGYAVVTPKKREVYAVVHQYTSNRHPTVMQWMRERYLRR